MIMTDITISVSLTIIEKDNFWIPIFFSLRKLSKSRWCHICWGLYQTKKIVISAAEEKDVWLRASLQHYST